ncbi:MAG: GGDEF domain-containing protein, partial [Vibrio sp.]
IVMNRAALNKLLRDSNSLPPIEEDERIGTFLVENMTIGFAKNETGELLVDLFNRALRLVDVYSIVRNYDYQPNWRTVI